MAVYHQYFYCPSSCSIQRINTDAYTHTSLHKCFSLSVRRLSCALLPYSARSDDKNVNNVEDKWNAEKITGYL